jgi:hypothetical protein
MKNLIEPAQKNWSLLFERISLQSKVTTLSTYVVDDWSYARAVQSLIQNGRLELTGFTSMPLIAHVFWGALFCFPFGFSFTAL